METLVTIFLFVGVMAVTAVLFGGWLVFSVVRFLFRAVAGLAGHEPTAQRRVGGGIVQIRCPRDRCGAINPMNARFCRRCGREMSQSDAYPVRRAAMW